MTEDADQSPERTRHLIDGAIRGSPSDRARLLERLRPRIVLWVSSRLSPKLRAIVDAGDVAQEILVSVHQGFDVLENRGERAFFAWLFSIARNRMVLADFGLARTASARTLTQTGQALGTPLYMSPEQILGANDEVDGRSDIYGPGVVMYECISGQPPFRAPNFHALMRMILSDRPRPLSAVASGIPRAEITVNGEKLGFTRIIKELPPGDCELVIARHRFLPKIVPVRIGPGSSRFRKRSGSS